MISLSQTVQALSVQQENATSEQANVGSTSGPPAALEQQLQANTLGIPPLGQEQPNQRIRESPERTAYTNTIIKDVIGVLPEYDPVRGNITSQQFISKTEQLQRVYEWNDGTVLIAIQHKMRGVAKEWLDAQTVFQSWEQFKTALLQDFPNFPKTADFHRELMRLKRKPNESFSEYFYIMMAIGRRHYVDEPSINSYSING